MKGYNTIEELSLQQSYEILQNEENNPFIEQIRQRYEQELEKWHADEKRDFYACKSMREYEQFIAQYQKYTSFYTMQYKKAALDKIETLFWNANNSSIKKCSLYLEKYPRGRYANDAREKIQSLKRKRKITIMIIMAILAIICIIAYKPAGDISVSSESVTFSKYGETKYINITTKASDDNIHAGTTESWLEKSINGHSLRITADENPNANRSETIILKAYSTFFGERISSVKKTITIYQESGLPTYLNVNKKSLSFDKYGKPETSAKFIVKTDGIGCSITSSSSYVHISKNIISKSHSPREIEVEVSVEKNNTDYRTATIAIRSGQYIETVNLSQKSGAATYLNINKYRVRAAKEGAGEGRCYRVNIDTDGASWTANTSYSWISLNQYDNTLDITVTPNDNDVRTGYVYINSNNGHSETVTVEQDGNPTTFSLSKSSYTFDTDADYEYFAITNNSDQPMSCYTYSDNWLHPSIVNGELKVRCENNNNSPRDGNVYIKCGNKETKITIYQKGWKECTVCNGTGVVQVFDPRLQWDMWGYPTPPNQWYRSCECSNCKNSGKKGYIKAKQ